MKNKRYLIGMACVTSLVFGMSAYAKPDVCDYIYAVHDKGLNDSQIVRYHPTTGIELLASYDGYDIESLDISSEGVMYGAASDDTADDAPAPGTLFKIDMANGVLTKEGIVCSSGLDGISFNPITEELWGWSQTDGLVMVQEPGCTTVIDPPENIEVEDLSWNNTGDVLYFVYNVGSNPDSNDASKPHGIGKYVSGTGVELGICNFKAPEIEALEVNENGELLVGFHDHGTQLVTVINPETCAVSGGIKVVKYNDIEGIAVCPPQPASCPSIVGTWTIGMDINCDGTANLTRTIIYHEDFTWSVVDYPNGGPWSQEGCDVTASDTFMNPPLIWTSTMGEDGNLSGTYSGAYNGCWTGTRSSADAFNSSSMDSPVGSDSSFYGK